MEEPDFERELTRAIQQLLSTLEDDEAQVLGLFYGLTGKSPMSAPEIAEAMGITAAEVRAIKERAMQRLDRLGEQPGEWP
ncbi:MAG: sigma factor-like helix-turn-helix DNA-binding protein [Gemmatimonadota bacterium]